MTAGVEDIGLARSRMAQVVVALGRWGGLLACTIVVCFWGWVQIVNRMSNPGSLPNLISGSLYVAYMFGVGIVGIAAVPTAIWSSRRHLQSWAWTGFQVVLALIALGVWKWAFAKGLVEGI